MIYMEDDEETIVEQTNMREVSITGLNVSIKLKDEDTDLISMVELALFTLKEAKEMKP